MNSEHCKGFTLVELIMGLVIFAAAFLTISSVFTAISKSILVNKTKTIATNLAQEKVESLKNLTYFKLLVSTWTNMDAGMTDPNFPAMRYDVGTTLSYYPQETLYVGGLKFTRRVLVEYLKQAGNDLVGWPETDWTSNDTGIKRITVYVVWQEGEEWKKVELRNMRNNPNRAELEFTISGTVSSGTVKPIYNAYVETLQNPSYSARTDKNGKYSFKVQPGTYTLRATATGYYSVNSSSNVMVSPGDQGTETRDFHLGFKSVGIATGAVYLRNHLVITQVVANNGTGGFAQEWVELYNPTTYNILIASRSFYSDGTTSPFNISFVTITYISEDNKEPENDPNSQHINYYSPNKYWIFKPTSSVWSVHTPTIAIPSHHFFLIAGDNNAVHISTLTYGTHKIHADAIMAKGQSWGINANEAGGIRVTGVGGYKFNGRTDWHDGISWGKNTVWDGPSLATEGTYFDIPGGAGLGVLDGTGGVLYRAVDKFKDGDCGRGNEPRPFIANIWDSDVNGPGECSDAGSKGDWSYGGTGAPDKFFDNSYELANVDTQSMLGGDVIPFTGTPAAGASVSCNDGLSPIAFVTKYGSFTLTNIATGTWNVTISSGKYTLEISSVVITPGLSTGIPHMCTEPQSDFMRFVAGVGNINYAISVLSSVTTGGYISGVVRGVNNNVLSGIKVTATGIIGSDPITDSSGRYKLEVYPSDNITVIANMDGGNQYATKMTGNIGVNLGVEISTVDFVLINAGTVRGFVTANGFASGALPGIPVVAYDLSTETIKGSAITGVDGNFTILNIDTGTYFVGPQLDQSESCDPELRQVNVTITSTGTYASTFTITNAFGSITGNVGLGSSAGTITTGVLVIATTVPITTEMPPQVDSSLRSGVQVYYTASSNSAGLYEIPVRGNSSYYIYGWYPQTPDVSVSSAPKRQALRSHPTCPNCIYVGPGASVSQNITW